MTTTVLIVVILPGPVREQCFPTCKRPRIRLAWPQKDPLIAGLSACFATACGRPCGRPVCDRRGDRGGRATSPAYPSLALHVIFLRLHVFLHVITYRKYGLHV